MQVLVTGATGLVGRLLCNRLGEAGAEVHALVRRPSGRVDPHLHEHVVPPEDWAPLAERIGGDAAVSALGTTMRKAGSRVGFRAVDHDLVLACAGAARRAGVSHFLAISSVGADAGSSNFYLRTKGEMEEGLRAFGFSRLDIFRPGLLLGERGSDRRIGERIGIALSPLTNRVLRGPLDRFAAIPAAVVADAMAAAIRRGGAGTSVHENRAIRDLARL